MANKKRPSRLSDDDLYLFHEGSHDKVQEKLGAHLGERQGRAGCWFAVWAPNAARVSVIGTFNDWRPDVDALDKRGSSGVWEGFLPGVERGAAYKFHVVSQHQGYTVDKSDPYALHQEVSPRTASIVWDLDYEWRDADWMASRGKRQAGDQPVSVYEVHLGSWRRVVEEGNRFLTYGELARQLAAYVKQLGFTHVELLPVLEHPFYGTWGYGATGYYAPTSRYGTPQEFMEFVDVLHREGVGVLLDWVPAHFPSDEAALGYFDGTYLYEHADPRKGYHPDWKSLIFNLARPEVKCFLIGSALFWLEKYHLDGIRVDAVASMLYLDYSRGEGGWEPNEHGGRENLEAIAFLRLLTDKVRQYAPDVFTIAEESTSWPMVSRPTHVGGLGFSMKWDMGWMHDTLDYMQADSVYRKFMHDRITFRQMYADAESFMLPLSHDEVVHGKRSLLDKMPGDRWRKFANLRLLFAWMFAQNGRKLLFMGGEFGQWREWDHDSALDWHLLEQDDHRGVSDFVAALNRLYRGEPAMHERDLRRDGFEWIDCRDADQSVLSLVRHGNRRGDEVVAVFNFTPLPRDGYRIGAPRAGPWRVILDSDDRRFGGSSYRKIDRAGTEKVEWHGRPDSFVMTLPPLAAIFLKCEAEAPRDARPGSTDDAHE